MSTSIALNYTTLKKLLALWLKLSTHIRIRDRSVKTLQYACQMLIGFYGKALESNVLESLTITRRTASTARKAFWLLKSFNHIGSVVDLITDVQKFSSFSMIFIFDLVEQCFLIIYYFYENLVFLSRTKLIDCSEESLDKMTNFSWFAGDLACFGSALLRFIESLKVYQLTDSKGCKEGLKNYYDMMRKFLSLTIVSSPILIF